MPLKNSTKIIEETIQQEMTTVDLFLQEVDRLDNYENFWKMYKGEHWDALDEEGDIPTVTVNKCRVLVDKMISFLVGESFGIKYNLDEVESILAPYVNIILENSGGPEVFGYEAVQMGCVTGDCFIKIVYDEKLNQVYLQVKDSKDVAVRYSFVDYKNNIPEEAHIRWQFLDEKDGKLKWKKEVWTDEQVVIYIDNIEVERKDNLLGRVPIVHIRNNILGKEVYGVSDIRELEPLNKLLNYSIRRFINDVDYNGSPTTLVFGARIRNLEKGENKMWGNLPVTGRVENLVLNTDLPAQQKMIEYISDAMHEMACIPKSSVTGNQNISNTSGVALYMNNLPIMELTDRKSMAYGRGFRQALMLALELMYKVEERAYVLLSEDMKNTLAVNDVSSEDVYNNGLYDFTGILEAQVALSDIYKNNENPFYRLKKWNDIEIRFKSFLPKDKLAELQIISQELQLGLESKKGAMKELGKENIDQKLEEIKQDQEEAAQFELMNLYGQPSQNVSEGMTATQDHNIEGGDNNT